MRYTQHKEVKKKMKTYKPLLIALVCVLAASVVGNFLLYTSLSSAASLENEIAELKKSKLLVANGMLSFYPYQNEINVSGALFNYGTDTATGISIKMTWYASNNKVDEATIVVEDIPGGHWRYVSATHSYVGLIDSMNYTIHWDQGEIMGIAVGPLITFVATEQLEVQGATFSGSSGAANNTIVLTVQNIGTADLSVTEYKLGVGGTQYNVQSSPVSVLQGQTASITLATGADGQAWTSGTTYDIYLITSTGNQFPYRATAP